MYIKYSTAAVAFIQFISLVTAATDSATTTTKKADVSSVKTTTTKSVKTTTAKAAATTKANSSPKSTLAKPQDYYKNFKSEVDPLNISIPVIPQTTSLDPSEECNGYNPTNFRYVASEWPTLWETATSNGMTKTADFQALYNSIDWSKMPNIPVRTTTADGSINLAGYDQNNDPDCWWSASTCVKPKHANINPDIYTCPEPETWGLTYDDGPNCSHNAFYDYLEENKLKASMFYIGSNVVNWPYGAQRGQKAGHHIADHTWSHKLMTTLNNTEVLAELYYTQKAIKIVTGVTPLHWRPAFGDVDDRVRWIATQLNLTTVLWNLDTDDWAAETQEELEKVEKTYDDFVEMGTNGTFSSTGQITLTHEINNVTMELAVKYLPKIQSAYKHIVDVATCLNITYPYQEKEVKFDSFDEYIKSSSANTTNSQPNSKSSKVKTQAAASVSSISGASSNNQINSNTLVLAIFAVALIFF